MTIQQTQSRTFADSGRELERLARKGSGQMQEVSVVSSPGTKTLAFAARIKGLSCYNIYNISMVELNSSGSEPTEVGSQMQAVNLAESFTANGQLPTGTYVAVLRVGEKNIFYAPV
jgi:hypothetical protein